MDVVSQMDGQKNDLPFLETTLVFKKFLSQKKEVIRNTKSLNGKRARKSFATSKQINSCANISSSLYTTLNQNQHLSPEVSNLPESCASLSDDIDNNGNIFSLKNSHNENDIRNIIPEEISAARDTLYNIIDQLVLLEQLDQENDFEKASLANKSLKKSGFTID